MMNRRVCIDRDLLLRRLREMGIVSEWKAFGAFAVEYLGLPFTVYRLLLLEDDFNLLETCGTSEQARANDNENEDENLKPETWNLKPSLRRKARRISRVVMEAGNLTSSTSVATRQCTSELGSVLAVPSVRAQQGQLLPLEIPEAGGEKHHLLPQAGRVCPTVRHLSCRCSEVLCDVCGKEDEGGVLG